VSVQNPVVLADDSEPQPDLKILRRRSLSYKHRTADAEDTRIDTIICSMRGSGAGASFRRTVSTITGAPRTGGIV
jgi:hypothetical protein